MSGALKKLLEHERSTSEEAPDYARQVVRAGLERELDIVLRDQATNASPTKHRTSPRLSALKPIHLLATGAISFVAGIGVGLSVGQSQKVEAPHAITSAPPVQASPPASTTPEMSPHPPETQPDVTPKVLPTSAPASSSRPLAPAPRTSASTTAIEGTDASGTRERTLLDRARTALGRGDVTSAANALDEHERAYPSGELAEERTFLRIQESLRTSRRDEAVERARSFRAKYPTSVLNPAIDRLLAAPNP